MVGEQSRRSTVSRTPRARIEGTRSPERARKVLSFIARSSCADKSFLSVIRLLLHVGDPFVGLVVLIARALLLCRCGSVLGPLSSHKSTSSERALENWRPKLKISTPGGHGVSCHRQAPSPSLHNFLRGMFNFLAFLAWSSEHGSTCCSFVVRERKRSRACSDFVSSGHCPRPQPHDQTLHPESYVASEGPIIPEGSGPILCMSQPPSPKPGACWGTSRESARS